jgi:hypothetical protein
MQVLCVEAEEDRSDVVCPVCGVKYKVYFSRFSKKECEDALEQVSQTLSGHHRQDHTAGAHPQPAFHVPAWRGDIAMSAAALLSGVSAARLGVRV